MDRHRIQTGRLVMCCCKRWKNAIHVGKGDKIRHLNWACHRRPRYPVLTARL